MGQVIVEADVQNLSDLYAAQRGFIPAADVRSLRLTDALVDTGASHFSLPLSLIQQLGLQKVRSGQARTTAGMKQFDLYSGVKLKIGDRDCIADVVALPEVCPPLIGVVPLELMDYVVDPGSQRLIGNPAHGGQQMLDMF